MSLLNEYQTLWPLVALYWDDFINFSGISRNISSPLLSWKSIKNTDFFLNGFQLNALLFLILIPLKYAITFPLVTLCFKNTPSPAFWIFDLHISTNFDSYGSLLNGFQLKWLSVEMSDSITRPDSSLISIFISRDCFESVML